MGLWSDAMANIITVQGTPVAVKRMEQHDYLSLTDIAKRRDPDAPADIVKNWLRSRSTIEFLGLWEQLNNPSFKLVEFDQFKNEAGTNYFVLSPLKWIETTGAIGLVSKSGRSGGTFAHLDIALEFASWISVEFKLYLIKEFQRLKEDERKSLDWDVRRNLAKINYRIHTDAIKENLIPQELTQAQARHVYANEADVLNVALFGMTAKQWRDANVGEKGNIRDQANGAQLVCLSNLESINAELIKQRMPQGERLRTLNTIAIQQMRILVDDVTIKRLKGK
jgi:hypothetical protein